MHAVVKGAVRSPQADRRGEVVRTTHKRDTTALDDYPHPHVAVDLVLLSVHEGELQVLLTDRQVKPKGLALPGTFVHKDEALDRAVLRVLEDKAHLRRAPRLYPLRPFGDPKRDSRGHIVSLPHVAMIDLEGFGLPSAEFDRVATVRLDGQLHVELGGEPVRLVFDHEQILAEAVREFRRRLELGEHDLVAELLPERFTLRQLRHVHEALSGKAINKDSFRRQMAKLVEPTGEVEEDVDHRPAEYYRWRLPG